MDTLTQNDVELDLIIDRITANLTIEQIFLYPFSEQKQSTKQLYVLLRQSVGQNIIAARALCDITLTGRTDYNCYVAFPEDINRKIKQGNIRATLICQPINCVYEHPAIHQRIETPEPDYDLWTKEAENFFNKEISRIMAFEDGYVLYLDKKNYSQASFMLHQMVELGFRAAENLVMGKDKLTHVLRNHQEYIAPFCPELGDLFQKPHELRILEKLDESYKAARYEHDFRLSPDDLFIAFTKAKELVSRLTALHKALLHEIQRQQDLLDVFPKKEQTENPVNNAMAIPKTEEVAEPIVKTDDRNLILGALRSNASPTLVSCFAYERQEMQSSNLISPSQVHSEIKTYYLFVAYNELKIDVNNLLFAIKQQLPASIELILVTENNALVAKQYRKGHPFFVHLLTQSEIWYRTDDIVSLMQEPAPAYPTNSAYRLKQWESRHRNALNLYRAHEEDWYVGGEEVVLFTLSQALEQACLGTIACLYGYRPNQVGINHLLNLCKVVVPEAWQALSLESAEQRRLFRMLVEAQQEFRYNANYRANGVYILQLQEKVKSFIDRCDEAVRSHFESSDLTDMEISA